jgi:hypothetical protein
MQSVVLKMEETREDAAHARHASSRSSASATSALDGHDLPALLATLRNVREWKGPALVHVVTKKGKGFPLAEENPVVWHGATPFDKISGEMPKKKGGLPAYTNVFGKGLVELGASEPDDGRHHRGHAERHRHRRVRRRLSGPLLRRRHRRGSRRHVRRRPRHGGVVPVVAIYSTFLQRAYDSIIHDVAIQNLPVVFAMDRAGLVGNDGPTHMGLYDIAYLLAVPNMTVTAPKDGAEMLALLRLGVERADGAVLAALPARQRAGGRAAAADIPPSSTARGRCCAAARAWPSSPSARWCCRPRGGRALEARASTRRSSTAGSSSRSMRRRSPGCVERTARLTSRRAPSSTASAPHRRARRAARRRASAGLLVDVLGVPTASSSTPTAPSSSPSAASTCRHRRPRARARRRRWTRAAVRETA